MRNSYDLIVIGAGPGGSSAAYFASKVGLKVLLVDKDRFPRQKICSGGLSPKSLGALKEMGAFEEVENSGRPMIRTLKLGSPNGCILEGDVPITSISKGFGYVVPRFQLDDIVFRRALQAGAVFKHGQVSQLLESGENVYGVLLVDGHEIKADYIILANGAHRLASKSDRKLTNGTVFFAIQTHYEDLENSNSNIIEIYFERSLLPGYFWIFPQGKGQMTVGAGLWGNSGGVQALQEGYEAGVRYVQNICHKTLPSSDTLKFEKWIIPANRNIQPTIASNVLLVGDAGGFANPFSGEGIYYALETGRLAGQVVAERSHIAENYKAQLKGILEDLDISWSLHDLMSNSTLADRVIGETSQDESLKTMFVGAILNAIDKSQLKNWLEST